MTTDINIQLAEVFLRIFTAILFLFQGYDKLFRIKIPGVVEAFQGEAANYRIPKWLLVFVAYYTSFTEFFCGLLLLLGLFSNYALFALGLDMILVTIAFSYIEPMWDTKHVFPRFILVILLLVLEVEDNPFGIDRMIAD